MNQIGVTGKASLTKWAWMPMLAVFKSRRHMGRAEGYSLMGITFMSLSGSGKKEQSNLGKETHINLEYRLKANKLWFTTMGPSRNSNSMGRVSWGKMGRQFWVSLVRATELKIKIRRNHRKKVPAIFVKKATIKARKSCLCPTRPLGKKKETNSDINYFQNNLHLSKSQPSSSTLN